VSIDHLELRVRKETTCARDRVQPIPSRRLADFAMAAVHGAGGQWRIKRRYQTACSSKTN